MHLPQPGFVFVLFNPAFPGLVKIGRRLARARGRKARLPKAARGPKGFMVAHEEWVGDAAAVELRLQRHFAERRAPRRPGFFRMSITEAVRALKATGGRARKAHNYLRFQPAGLSRVRNS